MVQFVEDFAGFVSNILYILDNTIIASVGGISVSYLKIVIAFLIIGIVVNIFWKGGQA